jgi:3-hydroxyisobutyrate dehydrogenase
MLCLIGRSWPSEVNNPVPGALGPETSPPCERDYAGGFASKLMLKASSISASIRLHHSTHWFKCLLDQDMLLAARAAETLGVQTPIGQRSVNLYSEMIDDDKRASLLQPEATRRTRGDSDFSVVYDYLKELSESRRSDR